MMEMHKKPVISVEILLLIPPLLLILSACDVRPPESEPDTETSGRLPATAQESGEPSSPEPADLAIDFAARLGYERSVLSAVDTEFVSGDFDEMWLVMLDDDIGPLAEVGINLSKDTVESFKLSFPPKEGDPESVMPGDDLGSRVIDALGFDRDEWLPVPWMSDGIQWEYRRYVMAGSLKIAIGRIIVSADPRGGWLKAILIFDGDLASQPEIRVSREEAIDLAKLRFGLEEEPVNVELLQPEYGINRDLYWEVAFEGMVVNVRTDAPEVI